MGECPLSRGGISGHLYDGSHGKGWTCIYCGDKQKEVMYHDTVDGRKKREAVDIAKRDFLDAGRKAFLAGYSLAFDVIEKCLKNSRRPHVHEIIQIIRDLRKETNKEV